MCWTSSNKNAYSWKVNHASLGLRLFDVVQVWVREPWCESERRVVEAHTAKVLWANQLGINQPAWWDHRYKQFIKLYRPRKQAIEVLAERDDALITYSEFAPRLHPRRRVPSLAWLRLTPNISMRSGITDEDEGVAQRQLAQRKPAQEGNGDAKPTVISLRR